MRKMLKWTGLVLAGLAALLVVSAGVLYLIGSSRLDRVYEAEEASLTPRTDSASLARGAHLVGTLGCTECHGDDLAGQVVIDAPPFLVVAPNLTSGRGGLGADRTVEELDRAIRQGVKPDGRSVVMMPSSAFHQLSDEDAAAIITHLKSVAPVNRELPETEIRPLGRVLSAFAFDPAAEVRTDQPPVGRTPQPAATTEYGEYLAATMCTHCHGPDLRGQENPPGPPGAPPAPDLVALPAAWSLDEFQHALSTGETPDGRELDPRYMPWTFTAALEDHEIEGLYAYLASLGATPPR